MWYVCSNRKELYYKNCDSRAELLFCVFLTIFLTIMLHSLAIVVALSPYYSHKTIIVYMIIYLPRGHALQCLYLVPGCFSNETNAPIGHLSHCCAT